MDRAHDLGSACARCRNKQRSYDIVTFDRRRDRPGRGRVAARLGDEIRNGAIAWI
jgi:hypothetical protein